MHALAQASPAPGAPGVFLVTAAVCILIFAFWLWMLIDCLRKEKEQSDKVIWVLIIVLLGVVGAPLYLVMRKMRRSHIEDSKS